jgi:hypothetical protein
MKQSQDSTVETVAVDVDRMTTARNMPRHVIPQGLTGEQIRAHILATAKRAEGSLDQHKG